MNKKIYLTIDDSPSSDFRENLDCLIVHKIPAVLFCIGNRMESRWADLIYAAQQGYLIGNHSYSHPHFSDLDFEEAKKEIAQTDALIDKLYKEAGIEDYDRLFRFPYGDKGDKKYGFQFLSPEEIDKKRQGRLDRLFNMVYKLHPVDSRIRELEKTQKGDKAEKIQQYLFQLGYVRGDLKGVDYDFFHPLKTDQDWSWTFDIGEWRWDEKQNQNVFLEEIKSRLEKHNPEDYRGPVNELRGMQHKYAVDLVLFHDRDASNVFFKPVIDKLISMDVEFLPIKYNQIEME